MKIFHSQKKRFVTLLETLIAMSLLSILLVIVFSFFKEMNVLSNLTEEKQKEAFKLRYLESRLGFIFERIVNERAGDRNFFFYCQPSSDIPSKFPSLVITYNNEIRADPYFSGDVLGRLYVDDRDNLCLLTWPLYFDGQPLEPQQEILCQNVTNLTFKFYAAPSRLTGKNFIETTKVDPNTPERDRWYENEWLKVFNEMPSMMQIHLEIKEDTENSPSSRKKKKDSSFNWEFAFVLPSSRYPLYYPSS